MRKRVGSREPRRILCVHTCREADHAEWVTISRSSAQPDGAVHHEGACSGNPLTLVERPGGDLEPGWLNPCQCWDRDEPSEHTGHCCFTAADCDHHDLLRACEEQLPIGDVPMHAWNVAGW